MTGTCELCGQPLPGPGDECECGDGVAMHDWLTSDGKIRKGAWPCSRMTCSCTAYRRSDVK